MLVEEVDFLEHYGVKGMKWGKRKARGTSTSGGGSAGKSPAQKAAKKELKAARSMRLGEAAVAAMFGGPIGVLAYKAVKSTTAKQMQKARDQGMNKADQRAAAKVSTGKVVALAMLGTPATALFYIGAKSVSRNEIQGFEPKSGVKKSGTREVSRSASNAPRSRTP